MCFSDVASFTVGAGLLGVGAVTIRAARSPQELPMACIPMLFGIQQVAEGLVWRAVDDAGATSMVAIDTFLFFALFLWPTYIPAASWLVEPSPRRRRVLAAMGVGGLGVTCYLVVAMAGHDVTATAQGRRIVYDLPVFPEGLNVIPYVIAVSLPLLYSSLRSLNVFGVTAIVTAAASHLLYARSFVSVWCFMAAIVSGVVMAHFVRPHGIGHVRSRVRRAS